MVELKLNAIRMSLVTQHRVVILQEVGGEERFLPIWIGAYEADAISMALQGVPITRPLTHDLLCSVLAAAGMKVQRVVINNLREEEPTFFASLVVEQNGQVIEIDSRPSDALAVAVRVFAPIFADENVMDKGGVKTLGQAEKQLPSSPTGATQIQGSTVLEEKLAQTASFASTSEPEATSVSDENEQKIKPNSDKVR